MPAQEVLCQLAQVELVVDQLSYVFSTTFKTVRKDLKLSQLVAQSKKDGSHLEKKGK